MITSVQMAFGTKGLVTLFVRFLYKTGVGNLTPLYERAERFLVEPVWLPVHQEGYKPFSVYNNSTQIKAVRGWISKQDTYFFEVIFENPESVATKKFQFLWFADMVSRCNTDKVSIKLGVASGSITVSIPVAIAIISLARCENGQLANMLIDMAQDGEIG